MPISEPINKVNLERITNGIFGFTMTLLARDIVTPDQYAKVTAITFDKFLSETLLSISDFVGVFILLAMFWMLFFQMFHRMKTYDYHFLHIHMLALMAIVLIPFSAAFSELTDEYTFNDYFFQINYFMLGIILAYLWYYARSKPELLNPEISEADAVFLSKKLIIPPAIALLGIVWVLGEFDYLRLLNYLPFIILAIFFRNPPVEQVSRID